MPELGTYGSMRGSAREGWVYSTIERRYTHRVAISNNLILSLENGNVSFKWRDYKDANKWKVMTISADEFIRRFLIHILPVRFMKIRLWATWQS